MATGDSIYRRTVAGHAEPSKVSFAEHMTGIQDRILGLPPETVILPGHGPATTVADELAANPFMRLFSGADAPPAPRACRVGGPFGLWEAELLLIAPTTTAASRHSSGSPRSDARWCPAASSTPPRAALE